MNDLIDRKALKEAMYHEAIEKTSDEMKWDGGCWIRYKMFERVLASMPSQPERKHGKWIDARDWCGEFLCSNCHETNINNFYKYCPNCGAEMETER